MRFVLLHNHIFKNAGSTVDHIFGRAGFVNTRLEASPESPMVYPRMVLEAIRRDPSVEYISSHVLRSPRPPEPENVGFIDITFLRHPIDRLQSIYRYTQKGETGDFPTIPKGVTLAQFVDRLAHDAPVHLFSPQTICLGNERAFYAPPSGLHLERAKAAVLDTRLLGVVDLFEASFEVFVRYCAPLLRGKNLAALSGPFPAVNRSGEAGADLEARLARIREEIGPSRYAHLERANEMDLELYRFAREEVTRRHRLAAAPC